MKNLDDLESRFRRIARTLPDDALGDDDEAALIGRFGAGPDERFLGFYTREGIALALESYGIWDTLRARGYADFQIEFDLQDTHHTLKVTADGVQLCACRLSKARGATDPCIAAFQRDFLPDLLNVEWLSLADPRREFTPKRPQLPGQLQPGSGIGVEVFVILCICARRLHLHGLIETPQRFHNAVMYQRRAHFIDPAAEGTFLALADLLHRNYSLAELAWALEEGRVVNALDDQVIEWPPREQLLALHPRLGDYFELPAWRRERAVARRRCQPRIIDP